MKKISRATLQRYPLYLKALRKLRSNGVLRVMSQELADYTGIQPTTIRRDFSLIGHLGKQGYGYDVEELIKIFSSSLGINFDEKIILVGAGNLGRAILNYNHWDNVIGEIVCAFDKYTENINNLSVPLYDIKDIKEKMPEGARIAILCISSNVQDTVNLLYENGIVSIVDMTHEHFITPKGMHVRHVDIVSTIIELVFETNELNRE